MQDFRILRQYHNNPLPNHKNPLPKRRMVDTRPLSLIKPDLIIKPVCERTPLVPSTSKLSTYQILGPGMILLKDYISIKDQVDIVNICQKVGMGSGGFYTAREFERYIMCFGRNWDPITGYENRCRSDGSEPPPLPNELISLVQAIIQDAQAHLKELPSMHPDICVVNFYPSSHGRLDLHQDHDESFDSIRRGLPVVSISIGEMADFVYGHTKDKLEGILLRSGDVLVFGGESRHIFHGVDEVGQYTVPRPLLDESGFGYGRLSLTFRQI